MKVFRNLFFLIYFITFVSCNSKKKTNSYDGISQNLSDTFVIDIPEFFRRETINDYGDTFKIESLLGIERIDKGFNEYQIRIWIYKNERFSRNCIIFKKDASGWSSQFIEYNVHYDRNWNLKSVDKKKKVRIPKSGWNIFIETLKSTGIDTLHDKIAEKYDVSSHPGTITVEISTKKFYRIYGYPYFHSIKDRHFRLGKLGIALLLIEKEFDLEF